MSEYKLKVRKRAYTLGDGVSSASAKKLDVKKLQDFGNPTNSYTVPLAIPPININGNANWGNIVDGFVTNSSNNTHSNYAETQKSSGSNSSAYTNSSDTVEEFQEGNSALSSSERAVVETAKRGVDALVSSADRAESVIAANGAVDDASDVVASEVNGVISATGEQEQAQSVEHQVETDKINQAKQVATQEADLKAKETAFTKAEAIETKSQANVTAAESEVASTKVTVAEAKAAVASASAAIPFSAGALVAAKAALAAAEAAYRTAQAKLQVAKVELEKATAEKELAAAERDKSKAQLEKDEASLKKAEEVLKTAQEKLTTADEKLSQAKENLAAAKAELSEKAQSYEQLKSQVQQQSSSLSKKLDEHLKNLKDGEESNVSSVKTVDTDENSKFSDLMKNGQAVTNIFSQGVNLFKSFTRSNQAGETVSAKRKMTAYESAALSSTLQSTANFCNNLASGNINLFDTGNGQLTNPFLKKPEIV